MIKDILLFDLIDDEDNVDKDEMMVSDGDVVVGDAEVQVCDLLASSAGGEWKNSPLSGWNMQMYMGAPQSELALLKPRIMEDLKRNNISGKVVIDNGLVNIKL